jgi:hypothetical protein
MNQRGSAIHTGAARYIRVKTKEPSTMSDTTATSQAGTQPTEPDPHYLRSTGRIVAMVARFIGYLVYIYILFVEVILFLGFFLLLFGANSSSGFVQWAYRNLDRAMTPFRGIFTPIELGTTGGNQVESIFDTSVLFAMIIYGIIGLLVHSLIQWLTYKLRMIERQEHNEEAAYQAEVARQQLLRSGVATTTTLTTAAPGQTTSTTAVIPGAPAGAPGNIPPPPPTV